MGKPKGKSRGLAYLKSVRPDAVDHLLSFFRESARHLDPKTRFLISIVTKVISNSPRGVEQYVRRALDKGATPDEILDAVLCAYPCAGLTRVVDAVDVILEMGLPGFEVAELADKKERLSAATSKGDELSQIVLDRETKGWVDIGPSEEIPEGSRLRLLAAPHDLALFRIDGKIHAIENRCPHAGGPLSEGYISGEVVTCPLHMWRFNLRTGVSADAPNISVRTYEVREEKGQIQVKF